jgi:hypothetical protein
LIRLLESLDLLLFLGNSHTDIINLPVELFDPALRVDCSLWVIRILSDAPVKPIRLPVFPVEVPHLFVQRPQFLKVLSFLPVQGSLPAVPLPQLVEATEFKTHEYPLSDQ